MWNIQGEILKSSLPPMIGRKVGHFKVSSTDVASSSQSVALSIRSKSQQYIMEIRHVTFLILLTGSVKSNTITCTPPDTSRSSDETRECAEDKYADFSYPLSSLTTFEHSEDFRIEIKLCDNGTLLIACRCRWTQSYKPTCKRLVNDSVCEADNSQMHLSLLVRRTYNEIRWLLFKHNSTPVVMQHMALQVTYLARVTGMSVNDQDVNSTYVVDENQEVTVSCSFVNGNPPVNLRMVDERGNILSSTKYKEGPLVLSLGVFLCHNVWPIIRCEAQGSELSKSVAILIRCAPQLSYITHQVSDLGRILDEGLTFAMKSYKSDIRKCLMGQVQPETITREVNCEVSGQAPKFTLTLRFVDKSWIGEGTWTVQVMSEMGPSSITFQLFNSKGLLTCD